MPRQEPLQSVVIVSAWTRSMLWHRLPGTPGGVHTVSRRPPLAPIAFPGRPALGDSAVRPPG
jgi:hypothetical protein